MTNERWEELLFEYGDRCYASAENKLNDANMVANAKRRKELFTQILSGLGAAVSAPPQPTDEQYLKLAQHLTNMYLCNSRHKPDWLDKRTADFIKREMCQFFAAAPAQEPRESLVGKIVRVNNPRFDGYGFAQYDSGDRSRVIGVVLENGNTWEYAIETVRAALPEEISQAPKAVQARLRPAQEQPVENSPQISLKDFSVTKALDGFSKEPPQPTVFSPQKGKP